MSTRACLPVAERLYRLSTTEPNSGCWLWLGATSPAGYPKTAATGFPTTQAHRVSYMVHVGPIPKGLHLDHLCRTPSCINPDHLEAVTTQENSRRARLARKTCKRGHPRNEANSYRMKTGWLMCRPCKNLRRREKRIEQWIEAAGALP